MSKHTRQAPSVAYVALQRLVEDHGDAFRWSVSKKGRMWVTLTHWSDVRYNTAVEMEDKLPPEDWWGRIALLCIAHYQKCFGSQAKTDTWHTLGDPESLYQDALDLLARTPKLGGTEPEAE